MIGGKKAGWSWYLPLLGAIQERDDERMIDLLSRLLR